MTIAKLRKNLYALQKSSTSYKIINFIAVEINDVLDNNSSFDRVFTCINFILVKDCQAKSKKAKKKYIETKYDL